jgi:flagellar basal-body rod protein FlgC
MSLFNVFAISGSAMSAESVRLNTVASNLANANSQSGDPRRVYRAREPVFAAMLNGMNSDPSAVGVRVAGMVEKQAAPTRTYDPGNPLANKQGYVYQSNVNPIEEMANMISASRAFRNSVDTFNTAKQLLLATLKLGE